MPDNIGSSQILQATIGFPNKFSNHENRPENFGLFNALTEFSNRSDGLIEQSLRTAYQTHEFTKGRILIQKRTPKMTITNDRTCGFTDSPIETDSVTWTRNTYTTGFDLVKADHSENELSYQAALATKLAEVVRAFKEEVEADGFAFMDSSINQIYNSGLVTGGKFPLNAGFSLEVPATGDDRIQFLNYLPSIRRTDDKSTRPIIISSEELEPVWRYDQRTNGVQNAVNRSWMYDFDFYFTKAIPSNPLYTGTSYALDAQSMGYVADTYTAAKLGQKAMSEGIEFFEMSIPGLPFPVGVKYTSSCTNLNTVDASRYETKDLAVKENWDFSFDLTFFKQYNDDPATKVGDIDKIVFLN